MVIMSSLECTNLDESIKYTSNGSFEHKNAKSRVHQSQACHTIHLGFLKGVLHTLDLIFEEFVFFLKNKATLDKVSNGSH